MKILLTHLLAICLVAAFSAEAEAAQESWPQNPIVIDLVRVLNHDFELRIKETQIEKPKLTEELSKYDAWRPVVIIFDPEIPFSDITKLKQAITDSTSRKIHLYYWITTANGKKGFRNLPSEEESKTEKKS